MASVNRGIPTWRSFAAITLAFLAGSIFLSMLPTAETSFTALAELVEDDATAQASTPRQGTQTKPVGVVKVGEAPQKKTGDWPMWGGDPARNNVPEATNIPSTWNIGEFDDDGVWDSTTAKNIKWVAAVGNVTYGNPVVADGKIYVGTNNGSGYIKRYPSSVDLGCLICYDEETGKFLWQHSSEKLASGRVHDWPQQGICCAPYVEDNKVWFVSSRGEVICLDAEGFQDGENDGPYKDEANENKDEADVIWKLDMMAPPMNISQHNMCSCSVTAVGDILYVNTSNGLDESHVHLPSPEAPSFIAMNKNTGEVYWTDNSPGTNILHGQWSSPTVGVLGGVPQAIFAGGDGWVYSFLANEGENGSPKLLWKFDANPKETEWLLGGRGTRNNIIATPVIYDGLVYVAVGQDPEHGEGEGHLWCIDPTKRGDVSPELAVHADDHKKSIPHRRVIAVEEDKGEVAVRNPNSAVKWHYSKYDQNGDGEFDFEEEMHRSCGAVAIKNNLLFISDFSGIFHCLDAKTGKVHWTHDMFAAAWGSPLIVDGKVYIGDEDGDVSVFRLSADPKIAMKNVDGEDVPQPINFDEDEGAVTSMGNSVYSTPIVANGVLFIANRTHLYAIEAKEEN